MINSRAAETLESVYINTLSKSRAQNYAKQLILCLVNKKKEKVNIEQDRIL
jgi:hypothetical protein